MSATLAGRSILVTRPEPFNTAVCKRIAANGGRALALPVIAIEPLEPPQAQLAELASGQGPDWAIFVSRNAVRHGIGYLEQLARPARHVAVGGATAQALESEGQRLAIQPGDDYTSEALLAREDFNPAPGERVLIVRGAGGRELLAETLRGRGASVTYLEVYRRVMPRVPRERLVEVRRGLAAGQIHYVLAGSVETLQNLMTLLGPSAITLLARSQLVTASSRVVQKARSLGLTRPPVLASGPGDEQLLAAIGGAESPSDAGTSNSAISADQGAVAASSRGMLKPAMNDQKTPESPSPDTSPAEDLQPETPSAAAAPPSPEESAAAEEHAPEQAPSPPEKQRSGAAWIAILALLLALAAAAGSAYLWQRLETLAGGQMDLEPRLEAARSETEAAIDALRREVDRLEQSRANLERARQNDFSTVAELSQRIARAEQAVAGQQGVSVAARETWVLAEVEYYLRIANERLQLARDAESARAALLLADTRLTALDDPAFTPVRAAIADELLALENLARPDIAGMSLNLSSLADRVSSLPLRSRPEATAESEAEQPEAAGAGWQRAADAVGSAIKGLVSVRRSDEDIEPLLAPQERFFLYRNLELKLEFARIALLERDPAGFRDNLRSARAWVITYFDVENARVRELIDTLADLETREIAPAVPDLSASLRALRQAQTRIGSE